MRTTSLQFHATTEDIYKFILDVIENHRYNICAVKYFPKFTITSLSMNIDIENIQSYDYIVISKSSIQDAESNYEFMKNQNNNLVIDIGENANGIIKESAVNVFSETEIDPDWKKAINKLKKSLLKGAWVVNPMSNTKAYFKNHYYTSNAQKAYENGIQICPIAGWNIYELISEE